MKRALSVLLPTAVLLAGATSVFSAKKASAEDATVDVAERNEKCSIRLFTAMVGESPTEAQLASSAPQSAFDSLVKDPRFVERFAGYINSKFNRTPGVNPSEDAPYYMTKYVLTTNKPWSEMFLGKTDVVPTDDGDDNSEAEVVANPNGLGYFRSPIWKLRYAGNESEGIRIVTAYRIMQNILGLKLQATTNAPEADVSATGRSAAACKTCHYDPWFALDKVATVFGKKLTDNDGNVTFAPDPTTKQTILGDRQIANDAELVAELVKSEGFSTNACRLAYGYLYARDEYSCDGPAFDACVTAFKADGKIESALAAVAKHASYCE